MLAKLAGHISLQDMITQVIDDSKSKIASTEGEDKSKKAPPFQKKDEGKKAPPFQKKEKGEDDDKETEKKASAIDFSDSEDVEKLASALDQVGEELIKQAADGQELGGESKGGGESLPVMKPVGGKQPYSKDSSKAHNVPMSTEAQSGDAGNVAKTQMKNDHAKRPGGAPYPKKGVMKTAGSTVLDRIRAAVQPDVEEPAAEEPEAEEEAPQKANSVVALENAVEKMAGLSDSQKLEERKRLARGTGKAGAGIHGVMGAIGGAHAGATSGGSVKARVAKGIAGGIAGGAGGAALGGTMAYGASRATNAIGNKLGKEASAVDFILDKMANVEKKMGGETLDSKSGDGPKPPSGGTNGARSMIASNAAATDAKKVQAKAPQKKLMSQVLSEPMQSKAHDHKVSENLRNASKGGVKIAAARALIQKIAEDVNDPRHEKLKMAMEKKKLEKKGQGGMPSPSASSMPSSPMM